MSRQSRGLQKEHEIAQEIFDVTNGSIIPVRAGYSGNSAVPLPDLLVPVSGSLRAIELKTSSQDRFSITQDDVDQIIEWAMEMTEIPAFPYLSVKFSNYEVYTGRLPYPWDVGRSFQQWVDETPLKANFTSEGNISVHNPTKLSRAERDDRGIVSAVSSPGDGPAVIKDLRADEFANASSDEVETVGVYDVLQQNPDYRDKFYS